MATKYCFLVKSKFLEGLKPKRDTQLNEADQKIARVFIQNDLILTLFRSLLLRPSDLAWLKAQTQEMQCLILFCLLHMP